MAGDGEEIEVRSPATGEVLGSGRAATGAQVDRAVAAAATAFETWREDVGRSSASRSAGEAYALCLERNEEIAQMITREVGKTIRESREEMEEFTADHFRRAAEDVLRHAGQVLPSTQERDGRKRILVVQEPVGVVAAVSPWNFPVDIAGIPIVYGLAVGCTVVWKPSEHAPLCAELFVELLHDAGSLRARSTSSTAAATSGQALVRHPDVGSVVFTGSVETGEKVARDAGLKNRVLELGGNGPQIVLADADVEKAADAAIVGCFYLAGQCCTAAERILVHESVKDAFVELLLERTSSCASAIRSTRRPTWARCARRSCSRARRRTSTTPSRRAPTSSTAAVTTASTTSRRSSRRDERDAHRAGGDVRAGRADHDLRHARRGDRDRATRPSSG